MNIDSAKLVEILLKGNYVTPEDIKKAEETSKFSRTTVIDYLLSQNLISKDLLGQAVAESFGVPYADLNTVQPSREQVLKISEEIAKKFRVVLFKENADGLVVTSDDPGQENLLTELQKLFPTNKISLAYSLPEDFELIFINYQKSLETRFSQIIKKTKSVAPEILEEIFKDAIAFHASDVHFEPQAKEVLVRFRVDGVMHEAGRLPKEYYDNILNRIKVQSRLRIDEHSATQDGSLRHEVNGQVFDLRTSIVPTVEGEKVVLRILASYVQGLSLIDLGLSNQHQKILEAAANKPFGMIIVSGPTGSGKTTTLYALIKTLNHPDINITTIEDPVEYKVEGLNQIQVNALTDLTFAKGLRSIVRQDPDVILVGEIRDNETAEIAVNAALTGHLLLSTFHANDAATVVPRMLDMGIEPFLLASTLNMIIAQRLVRRICQHCRYSKTIEVSELKDKLKDPARYFGSKTVTLYQGAGCTACNQTGFKDRTAIFEIITVNPQLQELILRNPSAQEIWTLVQKLGVTTLFDDGIEKVKNGITTLDELMRVAEPSL
jgi:type II secretory ATPase GspE/PulE/Tfp pilus assembly ATPase PilB-like protein